MRVLGIDPGTVVTGYGLLEENGTRLCLIEARGIRTSTKPSLAGRLRQIFEGIQSVIKVFEPDAVAVENTFLSKNFSSTTRTPRGRRSRRSTNTCAAFPATR